ncbi:MAG: hypothetical protein PHC84_04765 [Clostridia bacterium]|nr:hypothetical protein [Clostridia bacterium]
MAKPTARSSVAKMVHTDKADYKVPEFLLSSLAYTPAPQDFYAGYKDSDETPLWWTRDIDLPLTKKENRRAYKKGIALKDELESQRQRLGEANKKFKALLEAQEKEYKNRCEMLDKRVEMKLEELELLKQQSKLEYENRLIELELELQRTNLERAFYEKENDKFSIYEAYSQKNVEERQQLEFALAALDTQLAADKEVVATLKEQAAEGYKLLGKTPVAPIIGAEGVIEQSFMEPVKTKMERFDVRNILEVKFLSLTNKDTGNVELKNISFDVKRKGITVVYSQSGRVLANIVSAIMRTLPSSMQVTGGDVRIEGESNADLLRGEYREKIKDTITCLGDMLDRLARSSKTLLKELRAEKIADERLFFIMKGFNLDQKTAHQKVSKLDEATRRKLAVAACLAMELPLTLMFEPEEDMSLEDKNRLIDLLHTRNTDKATLIFTTDKYLSGALKSTSFYNFSL